MFGILALLFIVVPLVELAVIIRVGQSLGVWTTIFMLLAVSVVGASLVKYQGLGVLQRFAEQVRAGAVPGKEMADGVMILVAGALLLTPGFVTDGVGLALLMPPVRAGLRASLVRQARKRTQRS